jgi:diacylglycerol O-acyltransferase
MRAVEPNDYLFLLLERRQQPMHVAGLQLFSIPEGESDTWVHAFVDQARAHSRPMAPFNKCLVSQLGIPFWKEDEHLDLGLHLRHWALPQPGRIRELLSNLSSQHSVAMDRDRPLWECHVIEGLSERRFAVYTKVHHALMDGISVMRLGVQSLSLDASERDMAPFWARKRKRNARTAEANPEYYANLAKNYAAAVPKAVREALRISQRARKHPECVPMFGAPASVLNGKITGSRRVAAQSYDLGRVRALARSVRCTVNDIVLTVCAGALRRYLGDQGALPDKPLIAMVPMSMRKDDSTGGNQFALILANLGTHLADPADRLRVITDSVRAARKRYQGMTHEEASALSALIVSPFLLGLATGITPRNLPFNVVISNVPGPPKPLYWNGARLEGLYPLSIVLDHNALNITLTSYRNSLEFGIVGCRRTLPSMQRLLKDIDASIEELEAAFKVGPHAPGATPERILPLDF